MSRRPLIGLLLAGTVLALSLLGGAQAQGPCAIYKTFNTGDSVSAGDMNSLQTVINNTNSTFQCLDDYSSNAAQMNTGTDPNSSGSASLPTTGAGELERLRYVLKHVTGWTQWWTHYENMNLGDRGLRLHRTLATGYQEWFRIEGHTASAATRFHLMSLSIPGYTAGTMHPESAMFLIHVGTTVRFMVGVGGDTHVGNTLGVHAQGSVAFPALYRTGDPSTGLFWPAANHVAITTGAGHVATFHAGGVFLHAALRTGSGGTGQTSFGANTLLMGNADGSLLARHISGVGITITHQTGGLAFSVAGASSTGLWGSRGQFSGTGFGTDGGHVLTLRAHALQVMNASNHALTAIAGPPEVTVNIGTSGPTAGGRDRAASLDASTWAHFYWIHAATASLSGVASPDPPTTGPNLPAGYTGWVYAGAVRRGAVRKSVV